MRLATQGEDHDEMRSVLREEVLELQFVTRGPNGYYIPNGQDKHVQAADWLRQHSGIPEINIRSTLSRLPEDWPVSE